MERKPMTRSEIISKISGLTGEDKRAVRDIMTAYENILMYDLAENLEAKIGPIGKIKIKQRKELTCVKSVRRLDLSTLRLTIFAAASH